MEKEASSVADFRERWSEAFNFCPFLCYLNFPVCGVEMADREGEGTGRNKRGPGSESVGLLPTLRTKNKHIN